MEVSVDGLAFSTDGHLFMHYTAEVVQSVNPSMGSAERAHMVRVIGKHFLDAHVLCIVGQEHRIRATWHSSTAVECMMPALPEGQVTVQVSNNGIDLSRASSRGNVMYEYVRAARLVSISPSFGPVALCSTLWVGTSNGNSVQKKKMCNVCHQKS